MPVASVRVRAATPVAAASASLRIGPSPPPLFHGNCDGHGVVVDALDLEFAALHQRDPLDLTGLDVAGIDAVAEGGDERVVVDRVVVGQHQHVAALGGNLGRV